MMKLLLITTLLLFSYITAAQKCFVFIGGYNRSGLHVFELDTTSGQLNLVSTCTGVVNPTYFTLSANGDRLYSLLNSKMPRNGTVGRFSFNSNTKTLVLTDTVTSGGENPVYISIDKTGQWLACSNYTSSKLSMYKLLPNGKPECLKQLVPFAGHSIDSIRQKESHIHSAVFSPDNKFLFIPDLGADRIWRFSFDSLNGIALSSAKSIKAKPGSGPRHITFSPNSKFAYCTEELTGTVSTYKYRKGKLKRIQQLNAHADTVTSQFSGSDIHVSPDGKFLYSSNRGEENNLAIFSIGTNGKLKVVGYQPTLGTIPRIFALTENGKFVLVANQEGGTIVVFKRDAKIGLLTYTGYSVDVANPSCVKIKQY